MVWSKLTQKLDSATSTISLFSLSNVSKFITHTPLPLKIIVQELIGYFVLKTKSKGRVEVVQDENDYSNMGDDVFQVSELVEPYRVDPSIDLKENLNLLNLHIIIVCILLLIIQCHKLILGFPSNLSFSFLK